MANPELPQKDYIMTSDSLRVINPKREMTFTLTFGPDNTFVTLTGKSNREKRETAVKKILSQAGRHLIDIGSKQDLSSMANHGTADPTFIGEEILWQTKFRNAVETLAEMGYTARRLQDFVRDQRNFFPETAHIGEPMSTVMEQSVLLSEQIEDIYREIKKRPQEEQKPEDS